MRRQPEKIIQAQIVTLLRSVGAQVYVLGTRRPRGDHPGTCQTPGVPDVYAFLPPPPRRVRGESTALWVEVKAPQGRLRPQQAEFMRACETRGLPYLTGGLDVVIDYLNAFGWLRDTRLASARRLAVHGEMR